ncbi:MAG TPA: hypothetical protein VFN73_07310, partial [Propionibacteriaceae bacterium]|nr:hypothetical protein [Propionibacteriaceae bacterium]
PLHPGSGELAITAPLLGELSVDRGPSGRLTVRADHPEHRFVAALTIDGEPWDAVTVPLSRLSGDVTLDFSLSEHPTGWGAGTRPVSRSSDGVRLWDDLSAAASVEVRRPDRPAQAAPDLVDDRGSGVTPLAPGDQVILSWPVPVTPRLLTLTGSDTTTVEWQVSASGPGAERQPLTAIRTPRWPDQTLAIDLAPLAGPTTTLRLTASAACGLRQVEVLGEPAG